jgi:hypothetical protein
MEQTDYEKLLNAAAGPRISSDCSGNSVEKPNGYLSDEEAKILINNEFGFEASRIKILHEAEIVVSEPGSAYLKFDKVPRRPVNESTDWNYIRFNIRGCAGELYFEMVNGDLCPVYI